MKIVNDNGLNDSWNKFIRDGNLDALSGIYFHFYDLLFTYGMKHTLDKQSVEDSIQNVFFNLIKLRKNIGEVKNLPGYLLSSFRRQLFADKDKDKQKHIVFSEQLYEEKFDFFKSQDHDILEKENLEMVLKVINDCMDKLSSRQREILYLKFHGQISYEEIASMFDISVDSCYKSIYRSVKSIRADLEKIMGKGNYLVLIFLPGVKLFDREPFKNTLFK
jgi:RNA polymerase sigma factor (sigma-70 family)